MAQVAIIGRLIPEPQHIPCLLVLVAPYISRALLDEHDEQTKALEIAARLRETTDIDRLSCRLWCCCCWWPSSNPTFVCHSVNVYSLLGGTAPDGCECDYRSGIFCSFISSTQFIQIINTSGARRSLFFLSEMRNLADVRCAAVRTLSQTCEVYGSFDHDDEDNCGDQSGWKFPISSQQ